MSKDDFPDDAGAMICQSLYCYGERWTPPSFLRHVASYRMLEFINKRTNTCWTGMVMWKMGYGWSWWPNDNCMSFDGDYCGKWDIRP